MKVHLIALGCEKNIVNSEQMLWLLDNEGYELAPSPEGADVAVVNTCGFIESARQEAIDQILELAEYPLKIIVAGCLAERHKDDIFTEMPEVSGLVGCGRFDDVAAAVREVLNGGKPSYFGNLGGEVSETPRVLTTPEYTAYLKIAEGCSNNCAYCVIPSIRGAYRSRKMEDVIAEARELCESGAREISVIAQDTTRYGEDLYGERRLPELLQELCRIDGLKWLRLHYLYPEAITPELLDVISNESKIVKYLDIPMQHASDRVLRDMNRRYTGEDLKRLVKNLRERIPGVILRTSLIVGFPGETEEEFAELCDFLAEQKLERVGVFRYSQEEGTSAADRDDQVDEDIKRCRAERVEQIQEDIMQAHNSSLIGTEIEVLCEGYDRFAEVYYARSYADAPEVDGKIFFTSRTKRTPGDFTKVKINEIFESNPMGVDIRAL